jgi:hypothetical protein
MNTGAMVLTLCSQAGRRVAFFLIDALITHRESLQLIQLYELNILPYAPSPQKSRRLPELLAKDRQGGKFLSTHYMRPEGIMK